MCKTRESQNCPENILVNHKKSFKKKKKKNPIIPSVLVNSELVSEFEQKANLLNNYFASQFTPFKNSSKLPNFS